MGFSVLNALASDEIQLGLMDCSCRMVRMQERCARVEVKEKTLLEAGYCLRSLRAGLSESLRSGGSE